eukprot:CAMPEP_0202907058 /NCGR_PEP_ID=MMETSP1392-20130828/41152_1 /ASSEMBLY_ACC=CAM_ASM_000868 /TAXON_ID=225041 /ORGANISM="Chlamydomonas chlamydogama, Strain SAG 11-48b" /LENGTH=335 /DNA_ID=CAMNT_0049595799 /DNA_START=167 /DNA_END=1170 /DNA_ORIENTATION=+
MSDEDDYSDVFEFVQEDEEVEDDEAEDEVDLKIAEEHEKFKENQAKWQEQVKASRPWSAPPLGSPRPESQRRRDEEREVLLQQQQQQGGPEVAALLPRSEYEPPERPFLNAAPDSSALSYLKPARPLSADTARVSHRLSTSSGVAKPVGLQDILEESPLDGLTSTQKTNSSGAGNSANNTTVSTPAPSGQPAGSSSGRPQEVPSLDSLLPKTHPPAGSQAGTQSMGGRWVVGAGSSTSFDEESLKRSNLSHLSETKEEEGKDGRLHPAAEPTAPPLTVVVVPTVPGAGGSSGGQAPAAGSSILPDSPPESPLPSAADAAAAAAWAMSGDEDEGPS